MPTNKLLLLTWIWISFSLCKADGFHGAMNGKELDDIWERVKYDLLTQNHPGSYSRISTLADTMLRHLQYLNSVNVIPREFPNFRESGVPQAKASAMRILSELGKTGLRQVLEKLIIELKYGPSHALTWQEQLERARQGIPNRDSSLTPNEDYKDNLIKILMSMGEDALEALENERTKVDANVRKKLDEIIEEIRKSKKEFIERKTINEAEIKKAIALGVQFLKNTQKSNGTWDYSVFSQRDFSSGITALSLYALLKAGTDPNSAVIQAGRKALVSRTDSTYTVAIMSLFLSKLDRNLYRETLKANASWLESRQLSDGLWGYNYAGIADISGDFSNTQFALLGLRACEEAGIAVSSLTWIKAKNAYLYAQNRDGGFGYRLGAGNVNAVRNSYGSMTASAIASLLLVGEDFKVPSARVKLIQNQGNYKPTHEDCGKYVQNPSIQNAIDWLAKNFSVQNNPGTSGIYPFHYYYLFCLEQAGVALNTDKIGDYDWYAEGAQYLLEHQRKDGSWNSVADTAFALLFLSKESKFPLVQHLQWRPEGTVHENDLKNLLFFSKSYLGGDPTYKVIPLSATLEQMLEAPVLFINGHKSFSLTEEEREKLRLFLENGGTIYAEACCSKKEFDLSFRKEMSFIYPNRPLVPLPKEHPIYHLAFNINAPEYQYFEGYQGCQTRVIYSPEGHSCRWDENYWRYDVAFKLGTNVLLYAIGTTPKKEKELKDILQIDEKKEESYRRGALIIAQLRHNGDWSPDPIAMPRLMNHLREEANLRVSLKRKELSLEDPDLYEYPILYLTGHYNFTFTENEISRLRDYLEKGGFLFADACCGRDTFNQSFRTLIQKVFPDIPMTPIPSLHPIFQLGHPMKSVRYKSFMGRERPETQLPKLEMVSLNNRACLIYSPEDLGCALEDHICVECNGLTREFALQLATNIMLYGLNY